MPNSKPIVISVRNVTKIYRSGQGESHALRGVSLDVFEGEFVALSGTSGSGKTTLLNLIGCLDRPTSGEIHLAGIDTRHVTEDRLERLRSKKIGFVFQTFNLIPTLTALENVEYPLLIQSVSSSVRKKKALDVLQRVGLQGFENRMPDALSGGQRQRVAVARALVTEPAVILADEPTANLDRENAEKVLALMRELNKDLRVTFVFSTHDPRVIAQASRIYPMADGLMVEAHDEVRRAA